MYVNYNIDINKELKDITSSLLLSYFVGWREETQYWKQTELAALFDLNPKTIERKLKELQESQYIEYCTIGRNKVKTTKITLLPKAKKFIIQPSKPSINSKEDKEANQSQQIDYLQIYELYANKMLNDLEQ